MISSSVITDLWVNSTVPVLFVDCFFNRTTGLFGLLSFERCLLVPTANKTNPVGYMHECCVWNHFKMWGDMTHTNASNRTSSSLVQHFNKGGCLSFCLFGDLLLEACVLEHCVSFFCGVLYSESVVRSCWVWNMFMSAGGCVVISDSAVVQNWIGYTYTSLFLETPSVFSFSFPSCPPLVVCVSCPPPVVVRVFVPVFAFLACLLVV